MDADARVLEKFASHRRVARGLDSLSGRALEEIDRVREENVDAGPDHARNAILTILRICRKFGFFSEDVRRTLNSAYHRDDFPAAVDDIPVEQLPEEQQAIALHLRDLARKVWPPPEVQPCV